MKGIPNTMTNQTPLGLPARMRNLAGFTLIELLVVISIIAILAAIALPGFLNYRIKAFNAAAESDVRNFKATMEWYWADYNQYPPL